MTEVYLLPENVTPRDATMVLEFLNAATSAEEIATAVEIPGELDIGLRVAARILARRDQLGGFASLEQVYAVPYVGPERFTELVVSLSSARPPPAFDDLIDRALLTQINQRLNLLEGRADGGATIRLQAINPDALLGQETVLLAELKGGDGRPLIDRELTVVTTWGVLSGRAGLYPVKGNSVTVRSDHLGLCRLKLSATLGEALTSVETASLSQALTLLGTANAAPRDSMQALTELARLYRAPGNDSLRRAIDVYFKRYGTSAQLNAPVDTLNTWPRIAVTVIAWLTPEPDLATTQIPTTLLTVQQRNWFYAWLWAYRQLLEEESSLGASLIAVNGSQRSGSGILADLFSRVDGFVRAQNGLVGQQLGQTFAANSLNSFLQSGLGGLPLEERTKVVTGVTSGVKSLSNTQPFSALQSSRAEVNMQIDSRIDTIDSSAQLNDLESRLANVESTALTTADISSLRADILAEANQATTIRIDQLQNQLQLEFSDMLSSRADIATVNALESRFNERLNTKADSTRLDQLDQQVATLNNQTRSLDTNLNTLNRNVNLRIDRLGRGGRGGP